MTQFEAEALFEILSLLKDIKIELKSINRKLDRPTEKGGADMRGKKRWVNVINAK